MAGTNFTTVGNSLNRELHVSGRLGFHAPSIGVAGTADANQPYDEAVDAVGGDLLALARFRGRMWSGPLIKSDLINEMMLRRGTNYYFIDTVRKAAEFEIDLVGAKSPAITAASVKAGCANALALNTSSALANATWYGDVMVAMTSEGRKFTVPLSRGQCIVVVAARSNGDGQYATFAVSEINGAEGSTIQLPLWHFWPGNTPLRAISGVN